MTTITELRAIVAMRQEDARIARKLRNEAAARVQSPEAIRSLAGAEDWYEHCAERERQARAALIATTNNNTSEEDSMKVKMTDEERKAKNAERARAKRAAAKAGVVNTMAGSNDRADHEEQAAAAANPLDAQWRPTLALRGERR